jgi:hypothetical protein
VADEHEDQTSSPDTETDEPSGSFINDEFAGRHGTVASPSSLEDEKQPTLHPQTAGEVVEKVRRESDDDSSLLRTTKKALQELDRQVSGEYEHREDVEAEGDRPDGRAGDSASATRRRR